MPFRQTTTECVGGATAGAEWPGNRCVLQKSLQYNIGENQNCSMQAFLQGFYHGESMSTSPKPLLFCLLQALR